MEGYISTYIESNVGLVYLNSDFTFYLTYASLMPAAMF